MRELDFRADLYLPEAVEAAVGAFSECARAELTKGADVLTVRLEALEGYEEDAVAGEFANYVLGATVDASGAGTAQG